MLTLLDLHTKFELLSKEEHDRELQKWEGCASP